MTNQERVRRLFNHEEADRIAITDHPWSATIQRWEREGMPKGSSVQDFFGLDPFELIQVDISPRYASEVVEETEEYIIEKTRWGATLKNWKHMSSTPEFLDFTVTSPDAWLETKKRMTPDPDRIPWDYLKQHYPAWRAKGAWIEALLWFGFDVTHAWMVGTERMLMAFVTDPEWCVDMFNHFLDMGIALLDQVWEAGYTFDGVHWPDDIGYKHNQFFSVDTYRTLLKPVQKRAIEWAHKKGAKVRLHSCGDIQPFIPDFIDAGIDGLNPLEVKAGIDPLHIKETYGDTLLLHGGINALLWDNPEAIEVEMNRLIPRLKENGGYIFSSDHSVPSSVSLKNFQAIVNLAKRLGSYA